MRSPRSLAHLKVTSVAGHGLSCRVIHRYVSERHSVPLKDLVQIGDAERQQDRPRFAILQKLSLI